MSALSLVSFRASPSEEVSVTIPRAFEVNGKFYDLHIVAKDAAGDLVSLKDKISAFDKPLVDRMAICLGFCAQNDGGALSDYTITNARGGQTSVVKNHAPVANANIVTQIQTPMTAVLQTVQTIAQTPLHALRVPPQLQQTPARTPAPSASSTSLPRFSLPTTITPASSVRADIPPPVPSMLPPVLSTPAASPASPASKKGWSKAKAAAVAVAGTAALAGAAYLYPPLAATLVSAGTSLATNVPHYVGTALTGIGDVASLAWDNGPTLAGTTSLVTGAWNAVSSRLSSSAVP